MSKSILALTGLSLAAPLLWGCTPTPGGTPDDPADAGSTGGESSETECLLGTWNLDVADYQVQSAAFLQDTGIPIEDFHFDGGQVLTITPNFMTVATDIANWQRTYSTSEELAEGFVAPSVDFTDIPAVTVACSGDSLVLRGPGAPLSASWTRAV